MLINLFAGYAMLMWAMLSVLPVIHRHMLPQSLGLKFVGWVSLFIYIGLGFKKPWGGGRLGS
jgi:hypothetical protein